MNNIAKEYAKRIIDTVFNAKSLNDDVLNTIETELISAYNVGKSGSYTVASAEDMSDFGIDDIEPNEFDAIPSTFLMHE